jgi:glycosyltransferase involved in cell wall biosynthesis
MTVKPWSLSPITAFQAAKGTPPPANLVSVCVTLFNYAQYVPVCLDSIAAQTHKDLDLIVVEDKSDQDDSLMVAVNWAKANVKRFHRITVFTMPRNQGPAIARNVAFEYALGKTVFVIDADNEIYPRCIARLYAALKDGAFDAAYTQLENFGEEKKLGDADIWDPLMIAQNNYVDVMGLIKKSAWEKTGGFSHIEEGWEDYDFWLKFIDAGFCAGYVPEILCRYRVHKKSRTRTEAHAAHERLRALMSYRHPLKPVAEPQHRT